MGCPYGHAHCRGRGFCGIERWGWRDRRRLVKAVNGRGYANILDPEGAWVEVIYTRPWRRR